MHAMNSSCLQTVAVSSYRDVQTIDACCWLSEEPALLLPTTEGLSTHTLRRICHLCIHFLHRCASCITRIKHSYSWHGHYGTLVTLTSQAKSYKSTVQCSRRSTGTQGGDANQHSPWKQPCHQANGACVSHSTASVCLQVMFGHRSLSDCTIHVCIYVCIYMYAQQRIFRDRMCQQLFPLCVMTCHILCQVLICCKVWVLKGESTTVLYFDIKHQEVWHTNKVTTED